jgi:hypothetical protein
MKKLLIFALVTYMDSHKITWTATITTDQKKMLGYSFSLELFFMFLGSQFYSLKMNPKDNSAGIE